MNTSPISRDEAERVLSRIFRAGPLRHLPKSRKDTELLIALAAAYLDPQAVYTEKAINNEIREWMAGFTDSVTMDHVTLRRYMVDYRLVLRDDNGDRYRTNQMVLNAFISADARSIRPIELFRQVQEEREARKQAAKDNY